MALKGIVIDPGHGGKDPGAVYKDIKEKDYTLKISKYMYDRFKELGVPVSITRNEDITLSPSERTKKVKDFYGDSKDVIVISNHLNAGGGDGAEIIYALRNNSNLSIKILDEIAKEGQNIRKFYQRRLPSNPKKDYNFMLRDTLDNESIIIEYGFIDSQGDDINQIKNNYEEYAEAVVRAVCEYKSINYVPKGKNYYVIKKGDTLWGMAKKFNTSVSELKKLNNLSTNILKIGQTLKIPEIENIQNDENIIYIVKKGDNLYSIANKYGVSVSELKKLNNLSTNIIKIDQKLKIPNKYFTYIIKKGDTLWNLAKKYDTSVTMIKNINNLNNDVLQINQKILIPI